MRIAIITLGLAVSMFLVGCASVDVTKTHVGSYDPTNPNDVEILKTLPSRAYEELGTVTAAGFAISETAKLHNAVRSKAAELGANAVVLTDEGVIQGGWTREKWATGVALRYKK